MDAYACFFSCLFRTCFPSCKCFYLNRKWTINAVQCGTHQKLGTFILKHGGLPEAARCQLQFSLWGLIIVWHNFGQALRNIMTNIWGPELVKRMTGCSSLNRGWGVTFLRAVVCRGTHRRSCHTHSALGSRGHPTLLSFLIFYFCFFFPLNIKNKLRKWDITD